MTTKGLHFHWLGLPPAPTFGYHLIHIAQFALRGIPQQQMDPVLPVDDVHVLFACMSLGQ